MTRLPLVDLGVLAAYLVATVGFGCWLGRKARDTESYMAAGRSLPGWAVGLSIFGSYISSISFLANPGKSLKENWNGFVFSLTAPLAAALAVAVFVPFYRRRGAVSAYEHLEARFGPWARTYAVACYLLTQMARTGTIVYLLALAVAPLVGWPVSHIVLVTGSLMTVYTMLGGIEAVIWVGVVHSIVLFAGPIVCLVTLASLMPDGLGQVFTVAAAHDKFSLGSFEPNFTRSTVWVVLLYGLVNNVANFGVDQGFVQRYITARDDRAARRSVWLGALLYVPVAGLFFFLGTGLFALYTARPELLGGSLELARDADRVLPHFIATQLPLGLAGLVLAGVFAAAMDPSLNSMATLTLCDLYKRYVSPSAGQRESMWVLRLSTLGWGLASTLVALAMVRAQGALDAWWNLAGIFSGGVLGLFLLGLASSVGSLAAAVAVGVGIVTILWTTFSPGWSGPLAALRSPFHNLMTGVLGTAAILAVGAILSTATVRRPRPDP